MDRSTPSRILVAGAIETELAPLRRRVDGLPVAVVRTGVGGERAVRAVLEHVERCRPNCVVFVGFAGGLDPALATGDVLCFDRVCDDAGDETLLTTTGSMTPLTLLSTDHMVATPAEKRRLFEAYAAAAVDMETSAVAQALRPVDVDLIAVRAITDAADSALPAAARDWVTPDGTPRLGPPALWAATRPWRVGELLRLARAATLAAERLANVVERIVRERLA